jgi:hypothetical protein
LALQQVGGCLGYSGRDADIVAEAALPRSGLPVPLTAPVIWVQVEIIRTLPPTEIAEVSYPLTGSVTIV